MSKAAKSKVSLFLSFLILLSYSCEEPIDLDIAVPDAQIVVTSNFSPSQSFQVTISKSKYILSPEANEYVNNATVRITDAQGNSLEELQLNNARIPYYQSKRITPQSGQFYRIEVDIPEQLPISAESTIPYPVPLKSIRMDTLEMFGSEEDMIYKIAVTVQFDDPIGVQDYYHLSLYNQVPASEETPLEGFQDDETIGHTLTPLTPLESDEANPSIVFHYEEGGVLFTDEDFDGRQVALKFYSLLNITDALEKGNVVGELRTVTKDYYLYHTSLSRQIANKDRPFAEPITVYSNIENALGVFAGYATYRDSTSILTR